MTNRAGEDGPQEDTELTAHDRAQRAILLAWEDTPMEARLTWPEMQGAANLAISALRSEGWARA